MGRLKQAASDHPSNKVKAICIIGGPITRVEERQMQNIVDNVGGDYGSSSKPRIDVYKWELDRFKLECEELRKQFSKQSPSTSKTIKPPVVTAKTKGKAEPNQQGMFPFDYHLFISPLNSLSL